MVALLPPDDEFWDNVNANGYDLRFTRYNGQTLFTAWNRFTWDVATRSGVIEFDGATETANTPTVMWMYWDYDDGAGGTPSDGQGTGFVRASEADIKIDMVNPEDAPHVVAGREADGVDVAQQVLTRTTYETGAIYVDVTSYLARASSPVNGSPRLDEVISIASATDVYDATVDKNWVDLAASTFLEHNGRSWLGIYLNAMSTEGLYEVRVKFGTIGRYFTNTFTSIASSQLFQFSFLVDVRDPADA
jgi:hypothetical protein